MTQKSPHTDTFPSKLRKNLHITSVNREASWAKERPECCSDQSWNNNKSVLQLEDAESDGWSLKQASVRLTANKGLCLWWRLCSATLLLRKQMALRSSTTIPETTQLKPDYTFGFIHFYCKVTEERSHVFLNGQLDWSTFKNIWSK